MDTAAAPNPPDDTIPATRRNVTMAAGTSTGLKITSNGVANTNPITVPVRVRPERKRRVPEMAKAVAAFTAW
ncbi:hypothetical protein AAC387_Pa06g0112 [Persea americana]